MFGAAVGIGRSGICDRSAAAGRFEAERKEQDGVQVGLFPI